jgi:quercetin dioxygenase-like cupin family protein
METGSFVKTEAFQEGKPQVSLILETDFTKEIQISMKAGVEMREHQTPYPIVVHVLSGSIEFGFDGTNNVMNEGDLITLPGSIPHHLLAKENSIIRLSLSMLDDVERVEKAAK